MIAEVFFIFTRLSEIVFLIPIIGMLAYFVNGFLNANELTPAYILVLFIVSTIAAFWCLDTLIRFGSTRRSAFFVAFLDLCFFGALIAGVYELRFIAGADCTSWNATTASVSLGPFGSIVYTGQRPSFNKTCSMLKASFAMGIMEVVFFFFSAIWALFIFNHHRESPWRGRRSCVVAVIAVVVAIAIAAAVQAVDGIMCGNFTGLWPT